MTYRKEREIGEIAPSIEIAFGRKAARRAAIEMSAIGTTKYTVPANTLRSPSVNFSAQKGFDELV